MSTERVANLLQSVRSQLDHADATQVPAAQIGAILIAISTLTDIVEAMQPKQPEHDRYAAARHEYAAERRNDEWSAYMREDDQHSVE